MEVDYKEVVIKPVVKQKFSGISGHAKSVTAIEGAQVNKGGFKTGLTQEEEREFEKALGLKEYTLSKTYEEGKESFWNHCLNLRLPNDKSYTLIVNSPLSELKYRVLKERSDIAANELELAKNPTALFFIEDKEAKAKVESAIIDLKQNAHEKFFGLSADDRKGYLKLYGKGRGLDKMSDAFIKSELYKEVEVSPKKFLEFVNNPDIQIRIDIEDMIEVGTITKKGSYYNFEGEVLGNSIDAVVAFFKDPKMQSMKIAAKQVTKNKLKEK